MSTEYFGVAERMHQKRYDEAVALFREKKYKKALELFELIPESTNTLYYISYCLMELGELEKAERTLAQLIADDNCARLSENENH